MKGRRGLKIAFYLNAAVVVSLVVYKLYLNVFEEQDQSVHAVNVERIQAVLGERSAFSFAVLGNINNSIGIFEQQIIPRLNSADLDFVVSAGNAVSTSGEDKYRALQRGLARLRPPYLLTFGENEASGLGSFRFYRRYGPYFYAFTAGNSRFVFLDSTGKTSFAWQLRWLREELAGSAAEHTFVFTGHPLHDIEQETLFGQEDRYLDAPAFRQQLIELLERHRVDAVFSANMPLFDMRRENGVAYVTTGGAGGLVLNNKTSFSHYVTVTVDGPDVDIALQRLDIGQNRILSTVESLWLFIHSLIYTGYLNFLLLISALLALGIRLYSLIFIERDYYRDFDVDITPYAERPLRVAMFTNNYLPFIGGVPLSIDRLRRGLEALGRTVLVVAPRYRDQPAPEAEPHVYRVPSLVALGTKGDFRMANIFLPRIGLAVRRFAPDIIHVHHPFWLGSMGVWLARRLQVPAVFTYHTRLEHYAHYVPLPGMLFRNLISHYLVRRFANKCDGVIVPTSSAEEYLRVIGVTSHIAVLPTGIDYERFRAVDDAGVAALRQRLGIGRERVLVSVSRLSQEKNIEFMLRAVARLKQACEVPFRLVVIGDGRHRGRLEYLIESLGLSGTVVLAGAVPPDDMPLYYRLGDVFVFTSKSETQGMVILEAMASGLPVVAVRSSGIDDVVQEHVTGFKTPGNEAKWCARIQTLLSDDTLREELAGNARRFSREFSIERIALQVNSVYAYLLATRRRRATDR